VRRSNLVAPAEHNSRHRKAHASACAHGIATFFRALSLRAEAHWGA
jgi:hypothetical protein